MRMFEDQGFEVLINDAAATFRSNSQGGNCVALAPAVVPEGHPKAGRGPVVALYDTEDPEKRTIIFTVEEIKLFHLGLTEDHFKAVFTEAATLATMDAELTGSVAQ